MRSTKQRYRRSQKKLKGKEARDLNKIRKKNDKNATADSRSPEEIKILQELEGINKIKDSSQIEN